MLDEPTMRSWPCDQCGYHIPPGTTKCRVCRGGFRAARNGLARGEMPPSRSVTQRRKEVVT
jgi:hypothetical protein